MLGMSKDVLKPCIRELIQQSQCSLESLADFAKMKGQEETEHKSYEVKLA